MSTIDWLYRTTPDGLTDINIMQHFILKINLPSIFMDKEIHNHKISFTTSDR